MTGSYTNHSLVYKPINELPELFRWTKHLVADAEWSNLYVPHTHMGLGGYLPQFISYQLLLCDDGNNPTALQLFIHRKYRNTITEWSIKVPTYVTWVDDDHVANGLLTLCGTHFTKQLTLTIYSSPVDVQLLVGTDFMRHWLLGTANAKGFKQAKPPDKKRNFTGRFVCDKWQVTVKDRIGMFNSSLAAALVQTGIDPIGKHLPDVWAERYSTPDSTPIFTWTKGNMETPATDNLTEFAVYAAGDVIDLHEAVNIRIGMINQLVSDSFNFHPNFTFDNVPGSSGALVNCVFMKWFANKYTALYVKTFEFTNTFTDKQHALVREMRSMSQDTNQAVAVESYEAKFKGKTNPNNTLVHGFAQAAIPTFALHNPKDTGIYGAVVHGGRCINEDHQHNTYNQRIHNVVDIDLSGCYGSALSKFDYPLGIPTVIGYDVDNLHQTLGQMLTEIEPDLVDGLWVMYLKGDLSFPQDLLVSKYNLDTHKISKTIIGQSYSDGDDNCDPNVHSVELAHIDGDFSLTTNELELAVLTASSWGVLKAVLSNAEMAEFKQLKVQAVVYYPKKLELTHDAFIAHDFGVTERDPKTKQLVDKRSRCWTSVPLGDFIKPLSATRKRYKAAKKVATTPSEVARYDGLQNSVKLFINTTYGVLASPYFAMGNTVLANNITDKARVGVWMLSKALLTVQSITDGGMFSANSVATLKPSRYGNRKPGIAVLADRDSFKGHRAVVVTKLMPDLKHSTTIKAWLQGGGTSGELDATCTAHVNSFWGHYGLSLPFDIECKADNTADFAVYRGKGDYCLVGTIDEGKSVTLPDGTTHNYVIKARGARDDEHPSRLALLHIAFPVLPYPEAVYASDEIVGVKQYQSQRNGSHDFLPGSTLTELTVYAYNPMAGYSYSTRAEQLKAEMAMKKVMNKFKGDIRKAALHEYKGTGILSSTYEPYNVFANIIKPAKPPKR